MHELPDVEPAPTTDAEPEPDLATGVLGVDKNGRSPEQATWHADVSYASYLLNYGLLEPFDGYTFAIYQEQVVGRGKDYQRLLNRVTKTFGVESWQVVLIDPETGLM